jgi:hypothetical protein
MLLAPAAPVPPQIAVALRALTISPIFKVISRGARKMLPEKSELGRGDSGRTIGQLIGEMPSPLI